MGGRQTAHRLGRISLLELLQYLTIVVVGLQLFLSLKSCGREA